MDEQASSAGDDRASVSGFQGAGTSLDRNEDLTEQHDDESMGMTSTSKSKKRKKKRQSGNSNDKETTKAKRKKGNQRNAEPIPRETGKNTDKFDESIRTKFVGDFEVPVDNLVQPPPHFQQRKVNPQFSKTIVDMYNPKQGFGLGFGCTKLPVAIVNYNVDNFEPSNAKFYTLGGNHLREAIATINKAGKLHKDHQTMRVSAYRDLTSVEGLRLGKHHNMVTHHTHKSTFMDKVTLARKLYFKSYKLMDDEEVPAWDNTRDGKRKAWKREFCRAMNETDLGKNILEKYTTVFFTSRLSKACWVEVVSLMKEKPTLGAGTFKNLHGLNEAQILEFLGKLSAGDLPTYAKQKDEAVRMKKLADLKKKLPKLLHKNSWEETMSEFPCLTDEALHSYLPLDWSKGTPKTVDTLCIKLHQAEENALQCFSYNGAELQLCNVESDEDVITFIEVNEIEDIPVDKLKLESPMSIILTTFELVSNIVHHLDELNIKWERSCLSYANTLKLLVVINNDQSIPKVFKRKTKDDTLEAVVNRFSKNGQWVRCDKTDIALAALRCGRNVICKDLTGEVRDHAVMLIESAKDTETNEEIEDGQMT